MKTLYNFIKNLFKPSTTTLTKEQEEELKSSLERNSKYQSTTNNSNYDYNGLDGRNH